MDECIKKAGILIEAMSYINHFHGKTVVIKYGGSAMTDKKIKHSVIGDIAFMKMVGINPVVVHGGGPLINEALKNANIEPEFKNGLRVTDQDTVEIVESVLSGSINKSIVSGFQKHNVKAVGISGKDGLLIEAKKSAQDIGFVGDITKINPQIIKTLIDSDFIPVVSPVGTDTQGNTYNINADYAAVELAIALKAVKLVFLTDVDGIRKDVENAASLVSKTSPEEIKKLIADGTISGGMIPKVECCTKAVNAGVKSVHIISGKIQHSLLLEIYTDEGIGTVIED
jgi:acetylglutamate kinase